MLSYRIGLILPDIIHPYVVCMYDVSRGRVCGVGARVVMCRGSCMCADVLVTQEDHKKMRGVCPGLLSPVECSQTYCLLSTEYLDSRYSGLERAFEKKRRNVRGLSL